jgi:RNA polymerase sigma factor (sigma-70 family)
LAKSVTQIQSLRQTVRMEQWNDSYYIESVRKGDVAAFSYLVEHYSGMVYSISLKILKNEADAEDLSQEVFISAYQSLGSFKGNSKFSTWLYRITYNMAISVLRKGSKEFYTENEIYLERKGGELEIGPGFHETEELVGNLQGAIKQLPDDEQLLVMLFYYDGQTVDDIARITTLSVSNVKVKLHRIRKRLKELLSLSQPEKNTVF